MSAGIAAYQVVGMSSQELLEEFLASVSKHSTARFNAISLDDPSLEPSIHRFEVCVKEMVRSKKRPTLFTVEDPKNPEISFQVEFFKNQEAASFEIII